jgi:hypothetical protein
MDRFCATYLGGNGVGSWERGKEFLGEEFWDGRALRGWTEFCCELSELYLGCCITNIESRSVFDRPSAARFR